MGACCGGMKTGQHKSLPENEKANNIGEKNDQCVNNGLQGDAAVTKETPSVAADQQQQHSAPDQTVSDNHTSDHCQPSAVASPDEVELKITEPDRAEPAPVEHKPEQAPVDVAEPATQPTPTDDELVITDSDQKMPPTEALFVSEGDGDSVPPKSMSTSVELVETTVDVRTSTVDASVQRDDQQPEVGTVVDVECVKPYSDDVAVSSEAEEPSSPAVVEETLATLTGEIADDDRQRQVDVDLVAEGSVDQSPPPVASEQTHHETTDAQPEQTDLEQLGEQLTTSAGPQDSDAPGTTAYEIEAGLETSGLEVETHVEDVAEQSPPTDNESVPTAVETPLLADLPPDVTVHEVESDNPVVNTESSEEPQLAIEVMGHREDTDVPSTDGVTSSDAAAMVVDDSEVRLEQAVSLPVSHPDHIETHPETLDARPPADEQVEQETATNCHQVETSQRPDEHHSVNESTDTVVEPTSNSTTDTADQVDELPPATDQP